MLVSAVRLAALLLLLLPCLSGCDPRASGGPLSDRAGAEVPPSAPLEPTFTPVPSATPTPVPHLTVSGAYDNPVMHMDGRYVLQLAGSRVAATFSTARSPVEHWVRRTVPQPLFTVPEPFRPPYPVLRTVEGTPVRADGVPDPARSAPHRFLLRVDPDGTVHYVDDARVEGAGYLAYVLHTVWDTTPPPTPLPRPTPTPTFVHMVPSPTPSLTVSGPYDNQVEHADGRYSLQLSGTRVAATFSTARSPVQYWAREVAAPLFMVPEPFRPPYSVLRTVEGIPVRADGTWDHSEPRRFLLRVDPDGTVHYVDDAQVEGEDQQAYCLNLVGLRGGGIGTGSLRPPAGIITGTLRAPAGALQPPPPSDCAAAPGRPSRFLAYSLHTTWGTTPAANDRAVLEILDRHWFGETLLSSEPPPVQFEVPAHAEIKRGTIPGAIVGAFVMFDADGRVTALGVPSHQHKFLAGAPVYDFNGPLLPELGQLHHLEHLDLGYRVASKERAIGMGPNSLTGAIPPQLWRLPRLRYLDLRGQLLAWTLPSDIGRLASLKYLDLSHNWLSGSLPPELERLVSLEYLDLGDNEFTGPLPPALGRLASLEYLDLGDNEFTGSLPLEWGELVNLTVLRLPGNQLSGSLPPEWGQLANLERLDLSGSPAVGDNQLTGALPPEWGQLASLEHMELSHNQLTGSLPPELGHLRNLKYLWLNHNQLSGPLPPELWQLTNLKVLRLNNNQLTGPIPSGLEQMTNLEELRLGGNQLTGSLPTPTPTSTPTPKPTRIPTATPIPSVRQSGSYDNLAEHWDGRYALELAGERVAATFSTTRSPVQYWAREVTVPMFTVPEPFRPPYPILRTVEGRPVHIDGAPDLEQTEIRRFLLRVDPDGAVHYADDALVESVGYLSYTLDTVWGTTPVANDRAVLEILDGLWFPTEPLPVLMDLDTWDTEDGRVRTTGGRVTSLQPLETEGYEPSPSSAVIPAELGELSRLEHLVLFPFGLVSNSRPPDVFPLPPEIGRLTRLKTLSVNYSGLTALPPEIGQLAQLEELVLAGNRLRELPPEIGQLDRLENLHLGQNELVSLPQELGQLAGLQSLYLHGNGLNALPPEIGNLTNLGYLGLEGNQLTTLPSEIGNLTNLGHLGLRGNQLTVLPPEIGQLNRLGRLSLEDNRLTALPPEIGDLNLRLLYLEDNQLTTLPPELGRLTGLYEIYGDNNQLTALPPEIGQLTGLHHLYLSNNRLTALPPELGRLPNLEVLSLHGNELTVLPAELGRLPNLAHLVLSGNRLTVLPPELGQLPSLRFLSLSGNQLTMLPPELGQLPNLWKLDLSNNRLITLPPELGRLPGLQVLDLDHNQLTSIPSRLLLQLTNLHTLNLNNNQLTDLPWDQLGRMAGLRKLVVYYNPLTGCVPRDFPKDNIDLITALARCSH